MTEVTFRDLGIAEALQRALHAENYLTPTPIQTQAIPVLLTGKDILGIAQTGTGKTAAFLLPILQKLAENRGAAAPRSTRALVLAPTRELAAQIAERARAYGHHLGLRHAVVFGGVGIRPQMAALQRGVDLLIATPGRLLDLIHQGQLRLDRVTHLVLDEADRMLDMGFIRDVRKIVAMMPKERQSLLFSATMPGEIARLAADLLRSPVRIEVAPAARTADRIEQQVYMVNAPAKRGFLTRLLADPSMARVIVFTRTKHGANRVAEHLDRAGIVAEAIHGNKSQGARQRALEAFRSGEARVLVATDIAARGIDIDDISHVVNFDIPNDPESYVHRIGRTARAGASGIAISLCDGGERAYLRDIERLTQQKIPVAGAVQQDNAAPGRRGHHDQPRQGQSRQDQSRQGQSRQGQSDQDNPRDGMHHRGRPQRGRSRHQQRRRAAA